jgi:hypothetical protein
MSWGASYKVIYGEWHETSVSNVEVAQHQDQYLEALAAAKQLVDSGVFGDLSKFDFIVTTSGHGNEGHVPSPGWSNDFVSINIYQVPREVNDENR